MRFFTTYSWTWTSFPLRFVERICDVKIKNSSFKIIVFDHSCFLCSSSSQARPVPRSRDSTCSQSGGRTCRWMDVRQVYAVSCMLGSHAVRPCVRARTRPVHTATRRISSARQSFALSHFVLYKGTHASQCAFARSVICTERRTLQTGQDLTHTTTSDW